MEFVLELILEIILEGSMEATSSRRVPLFLRILLAVLLLGFYGFICFLLLAIGIQQKEPILIFIGFCICALAAYVVIDRIIKIRRRR